MFDNNKHGTILLVDDEPEIIKFFKWQLETLNYKVFSASSGKDAISIIEKTTIHVMVTDIRMPGIDGIVLMQRSLEIQPDIQCIVFTGHGDIETAIEAMRLGAINYLLKPIKLAELDLAIQKGLEKLRLMNELKDKTEKLEDAVAELTILRDKLSEELSKTKDDLYDLKKRELLVKLMNYILNCWEQTTHKSKVDLADESGIWTISLDKHTGTYSTRTLDKYLRIEKLPGNPRWRNVLRTAFFIMDYCPLNSTMEVKMNALIQEFESY